MPENPEELSEDKKEEERLKRKLLLLEKRFVDIELVFDELKEKLKGLDPEALSDVEERMEDLEDLALVDSLGITELKNVLEDIREKYEELESKKPIIKNILEDIQKKYEVSMTPEDLEKITSSAIPIIESTVLPKIEQKIEEKLKVISTEKGYHTATEKLDKSIAGIKKEVEYLKGKIKPLETEITQKIVSEIADLRTETGKDIMDIRDKIEGVSATKSDIDIRFLSSRVNRLKENIDYILNRKTETDLKIENLKKVIIKIAEEAVSTDIIKTVEKNKMIFLNLNDRIDSIEKSLKTLETIKTTDSGELYKKIVDMYDKINKKVEESKKLTTVQTLKTGSSTALDTKIDELLNKIVFLESRIMASEKTLEKKGKPGPIVIE